MTSLILYIKSALETFFSLGQVLATGRFGKGPFQGSIDAAINLLSNPLDNTYQTEFDTKQPTGSAVANSNWVHIFPEAFVHQVYPPHQNTLRYFKWGVSRLLLESSRPPIVVPMFSHGFENVIPEDKEPGYSIFSRLGTKITFRVGNPVDENIIADYRRQWLDLVKKEGPEGLEDLNETLKTGPEAQSLRSKLALEMRDQVSLVRASLGFPDQDPRFASPEFWKPDGECMNVPVMGIVNKLPHHQHLQGSKTK